MRDIYSQVNNISLEQLDKTYKQGSKLIDSITATAGVLDYVEESQISDYHGMIEIDHKGYIVDITLDKYFEIEFSS